MNDNEADKIKMTIKIGAAHIPLSVNFNEQDTVREAEKECDRYYDAYRKKWPKRSEEALLAMIAYQFAYYNIDLYARLKNAVQVAEQCNQRLADLISSNSDNS